MKTIGQKRYFIVLANVFCFYGGRLVFLKKWYRARFAPGSRQVAPASDGIAPGSRQVRARSRQLRKLLKTIRLSVFEFLKWPKPMLYVLAMFVVLNYKNMEF